jgi:hypothetical protein
MEQRQAAAHLPAWVLCCGADAIDRASRAASASDKPAPLPLNYRQVKRAPSGEDQLARAASLITRGHHQGQGQREGDNRRGGHKRNGRTDAGQTCRQGPCQQNTHARELVAGNPVALDGTGQRMARPKQFLDRRVPANGGGLSGSYAQGWLLWPTRLPGTPSA